jgi:Ni/Co efflux regulator RcnB
MNKLLSTVLTFHFLLLSVAASANTEGFETHKSNLLKQIDERMVQLTEHRTCVSGSTSDDQIKSCHEKMRAWMKGRKEERMERRKERMEKRKSK